MPGDIRQNPLERRRPDRPRGRPRARREVPSIASSGANPRVPWPPVAGRRSPRAARGWAFSRCSSKMVCRMSLMARSSSSTASLRRVAMVGCWVWRSAACKDRPVAKSRWITRSCMSRAILSRSSSRASRDRSCWLRRATRGQAHLLSQRRQGRHDVFDERLGGRGPGDREHTDLVVTHDDRQQRRWTVGIYGAQLAHV